MPEWQDGITGIGGRLAPEQVDGLLRNPWTDWTGIRIHNRILRSTLLALLRASELDRKVRAAVGTAYRRMAGVSLIRVDRTAFRQVQLDGNRRMYRFLMALCALVHERLLVDESLGERRFWEFRYDDATMWKIFEDFVAEFYRREQATYGVTAQSVVPWHDAQALSAAALGHVPRMKPDVVLESPARRIVLDAKYYSDPLAGAYGARKLRSGNLYQILSYLRNRQVARPEGPRHDGILLYPAVEESFSVDLVLEGFRVQARTIDLGQPWQVVHREMLAVVDA